MLKIKNVSKAFNGPQGQVEALSEISLSVSVGQLIALQGPSGCGKTTLLLIAGALLEPDTGHVLIDNRNPYQLSPNQRSILRANTIGFVFQQFHLIPYLNILENILAASIKNTDSVVEREKKLIDNFNLTDRATHLPAQLSTGQCQRTALARALINQPKILLADEPTGNLDEENGEIVLSSLADFANDGGAVLIVTHDSRVTNFSDRTINLLQGRMDNQ